MRYLYVTILTLLVTSCMSINKSRPQIDSVNQAPMIRVPFDTVDVNQDGNITIDEYLQDTNTLDITTPGSTLLAIMIGVGLLVGILIFLTTCYKGPSGIKKE